MSKLLFAAESKKSRLVLKFKNHGMKDHLIFLIPLLIGILLIINYLTDFLSVEISFKTIFLYIGIVLISEYVYTFQNVIFMSDDLIASKHEGGRYTKWTKISEYSIEDYILIVRSPSRIYRILYKEISSEQLISLIKILNDKLNHIFKGNLVFENNELKVIKNN